MLTGYQLRCLLLLIVTVASCGMAGAEESENRKRHPWGRFPVGAWKRVRVWKETYGASGRPTTSVEETKTTLIEADADHFTLEVVTTLKAAGGGLTPAPRTVSLSYFGTPPETKLVERVVQEEAKLSINGVEVPCRITEFTSDAKQEKRRSRIYTGESPIPLKQETVITEPDTGEVMVQSVTDFLGGGMMQRILDEQRTVSLLRTIVRRPESTQQSFELHCLHVPGSVISSWTKVTAPNGKPQERMTLELIDFGVPVAGDP